MPSRSLCYQEQAHAACTAWVLVQERCDTRRLCTRRRHAMRRGASLDLPKVEAARLKVLAKQRDVGAVDDRAKGAVPLQPLLELRAAGAGRPQQ